MRSRSWWAMWVVMMPLAVLACALGGGDIASNPTAVQPQGTLICVPRSDWPTITVQDGDTLSGIADSVGSTVDEIMKANCLTGASSILVGQSLYVPSQGTPPSPNTMSAASPIPSTAGPIPTAPMASPVAGNQDCGQWFFTFLQGRNDPSCPGKLITVNAGGENFEGGRAYWYNAPPGATDQRDTIYVIYNDHTWKSYPNTWDTSQPESDPSIQSPANRYQPVKEIGKLWREEPGVRSKLGWAFEPESPFQGRIQYPAANSEGTDYFYIDHGLQRLVLRLFSNGTWDTVGRY